MHNKVNYLSYGRLVAKDIGYSDNDSLYTYHIWGNFGDLYKLQPDGNPIATIKFKNDGESCNIELTNPLFYDYAEDLVEIMKIIKTNWRK
jgi:hypothetical protein